MALKVISLALVLLVEGCGPQPFAKSLPAKTPTPSLPTKPSNDPMCNEVLALKDTEQFSSRDNLRDRFLASHNKIRQIYKLPDLTWDKKIADYAQTWANYLRDNNKCKMIHRSKAGRRDGEQYGENLAWNWISLDVAKGRFNKSPEFAVLGWSQECADYNYDDQSCTPGEKCGHFTQMVWRDSKKVGCGVAICDGVTNSEGQGRAEIWVCNYDPPGNIHVKMNGKITPLKPY